MSTTLQMLVVVLEKPTNNPEFALALTVAAPRLFRVGAVPKVMVWDCKTVMLPVAVGAAA